MSESVKREIAARKEEMLLDNSKLKAKANIKATLPWWKIILFTVFIITALLCTKCS